jgi:hypothetical protein
MGSKCRAQDRCRVRCNLLCSYIRTLDPGTGLRIGWEGAPWTRRKAPEQALPEQARCSSRELFDLAFRFAL